MLKCENLRFSYGKIQALNGISFEVKQGEIMSIIGANGAGKSTLMRCIAGMLKPQSGKIIYDGKPLPHSGHEVVGRGIALVPEGRWIFPNLTVEENLLMGGYLVKDRKIGIKRAYEMFRLLGERKKQRAGTLSGGEQQMLAIARGLMSNPKVLLMDEPSLGLAPLIVNDVINTIDEINKQGVTVLLVEQNARKALKIAHHACVIEQGKIVKYDTGDEIARDKSVISAYLGRNAKKTNNNIKELNN
ncbi:MAG: ABC transporter ATP-binding protein [Lutispora sp.]|nr:ABC transporter ATP-binding protein [Lutispora sp.]